VAELGLRRLRAADWRVYRELRLAALADAPYAFGSSLEAEQKLTETDWRKRLATREQFVAYLDWASQHGCSQVRLWVSEGNDAAERLYARHRFVRTGARQRMRSDDPQRMELGMALNIPPRPR
jgi:hypothetical protein